MNTNRLPFSRRLPQLALPLATAAVEVLLVTGASAQCALQWQPGTAPATVNGALGAQGLINAQCNWDPDGAGPAPAVLVVAGQFTTAGGVVASQIAAYDPAAGTWSALGSGTNGRVRGLTVLSSGELVACGDFTTAGGLTVNRIASWNGTTWSGLGGGITGGAASVYGVGTLPNGDLVVGGFFTQAGTTNVANIASWNGTTWSPLGGGLVGGAYSLAVRPNGDIVAGQLSSMMLWNGATWSSLGVLASMSGQPQVSALATANNGDLLAGGRFTSIGGLTVNRIARWDGTTWSALGGGSSIDVNAIGVLPNGDIVAGGQFNGGSAQYVARWNGSAWFAMGGGTSVAPLALSVLPSGVLVAGSTAMLFWNGATWSAPPGFSAQAFALAARSDGQLVAGGRFLSAGGQPTNLVAEWNGTTWNPLGAGIPLGVQGTNAIVNAIVTAPNGDVFVGGKFGSGTATEGIARWNGSTWSPLASGIISGQVLSMVRMPNGDLVVGGNFQFPDNNIARWDGVAWSSLGGGIGQPGIAGNLVRALAVLPNGDLIAGGSFSIAGGVNIGWGIARWDGTAWSPLGSGMGSSVFALTVRPNGDLVAGGPFTTAGGVPAVGLAKWNGTTWSAMGPTSTGTAALATLPNGDVVATGSFTTIGGVAVNGIARWNGSAWSAFGAGLAGGSGAALAVTPQGELAVGGSFLTANGTSSAFVARLTTTCPASATNYGTGCAGSGGLNVLTATALPWTGSTFRAHATGMPSFAFVLTVTGFSQVSIPIATLLPQGLPGCNLLVSPDLVDVLLPIAGIAQSYIVLPNTPALVGQSFFHQMVPLEVDLSLNTTAVTSTNALALTIGSF